jgi:hypothetical protein
MRIKVALGLMVALLLAVALRHTVTGTVPLAKGETSDGRITPPALHVPRRAQGASPPATQPSQAVEAVLLAAIEGETDPDRRSKALEDAAGSVSDADLPAMLDSLARDARPAAAELCQLLVRRWAEADAPSAAAWTAQLPDGSVRRAALEQVAIAWANTDLPAATAWIQAMPAGESEQAAAVSLGYEAARSEPVTALSVAGALPPGPQRDDLLVHAISQWAAGDSAVAADWAKKVPDVSLRERLLAAVAVSSAEKEGAAAATLAVNDLVTGEEQNRAVVSIVQRWAQNSPSAVASWVAQWPDTPARDAATQNLLALWTGQDSQAAAAWLDGLPEGALRTTGVSAYSQALADHDRSSATVLAGTLNSGYSSP